MVEMHLGIIGMSEGNRHPYSWSAICNGYDENAMRHCGSPTIPFYLADQKWPEARLQNVLVTHIWTQDRKLSEHIAAASLIPLVVDKPEEMIEEVDGVLLARDDAENHLQFAVPFLEAGLPVYIDKPIAYTTEELEKIYALEKYEGQIFTCSATRYAKELQPTQEEREKIGNIKFIQAISVKDWDRYAIHAIEPALKIIGHEAVPVKKALSSFGDGGRILHVSYENGPELEILTTGRDVGGVIELRLHGDKGYASLRFSDTFNAFKAALEDFVTGIRTRTVRSDPAFNRRAIELLEMGRIT